MQSPILNRRREQLKSLADEFARATDEETFDLLVLKLVEWMTNGPTDENSG